jgi:hypothetical protein
LKRAAAFALALLAGNLRAAEPIAAFPPAPDSSEWSRLLQKYVDDRVLVAYAKWKSNAEDSRALDRYLARFSEADGNSSPDARVAILVNAYNAFIIRAVLDHYPVDSVRSIPGVFTSATRAFGGRRVSLDDMEHTAVAIGGYRVHALIVCASRSCPPLDRQAVDTRQLPARETDRMRVWMSSPERYRFEPERNTVRLPKYFDWYRSDFEKEGVPAVLSAYAPGQYRRWLAAGGFRVEYLDYDWSLNDGKAAR